MSTSKGDKQFYTGLVVDNFYSNSINAVVKGVKQLYVRIMSYF